jgi:hypothetical protein
MNELSNQTESKYGLWQLQWTVINIILDTKMMKQQKVIMCVGIENLPKMQIPWRMETGVLQMSKMTMKMLTRTDNMTYKMRQLRMTKTARWLYQGRRQ